MADKLTEQLAAKVVASVIKSGVREDLLDALLKTVEGNVRDAATEALLVCAGHTNMQRDREWVSQLQGEWAPKSGLRTATTPAEVEAEIRAWAAARIQETRQAAFQAGYESAFPAALEQGVKLGWASHEAGKGLEEALKAAAKIKPH
jgi:hypothetical protein